MTIILPARWLRSPSSARSPSLPVDSCRAYSRSNLDHPKGAHRMVSALSRIEDSMQIRLGILTISDRVAAGVMQDEGGPAIENALTPLDASIVSRATVPDDV